MNIEQLIEYFNDGEYETYIKPIFGSVKEFFRFVVSKNLFHLIELNGIPSESFDDDIWEFLIDNNLIEESQYDDVPEEFKNHFLLYELSHNYEWAMEYITNNLITDVDNRPDGFYLHLRDREELKILFCEDRNGGARYVAEKVLSEDGLGHDWYFDDSVHPHQVVDELDDSNITALKDIIFKEIGDVELSSEDYDSDFFSELSEEQGTDGYFRIRSEDLNGLVSDEDAFNELCKNDLDELGSNLKSLYWSAENSAYEDEVYDLVYDGLDEYFEGRIDDVPREVTRTDGSKITRYDSYIKIRDFQTIIETFLENNKGGTYNDSFLDYFGSLTELMKEMIYQDDIECIDFRVPEYPDWDRTGKNINEYFDDYIY
jgi:hypothetical protein